MLARALIEKSLRFATRVFYRDIEILELSEPPTEGGWIICANHNNGLVDPLLVLCFSQKPVSFLAKSTLFKIPLIGQIAKGLEAIPVYRKQDGMDTGKNKETFQIARSRLESGQAIAIFPEGTSHGHSQLRPLKTGAIRLGLEARSESSQKVWIVPVGLFFTSKETFRSSVAVIWGKPFELPKVSHGEIEEGSLVRELTQVLEEKLAELVVQADSVQQLKRLIWAERIWSWDQKKSGFWRPSKSWHFMKEAERIHNILLENNPEGLRVLEEKIDNFVKNLKHHGIEDLPEPSVFDLNFVNRERKRFQYLTPLALLGLVGVWVPYKIIGIITPRLARGEDDIVSTIKITVALLLFPIFGIILATLIGMQFGWRYGVSYLLASPILAYTTLLWSERRENLEKRIQFQSLISRHPEEYRSTIEAFEKIKIHMKLLRENA